MANKRRIAIDPQDKDPGGSTQKRVEEKLSVESMTDRELSLKANWKDWFLRVYLKYLFIVGAMFLLYMIPAETLRLMEGDLSIVLAFVSVIIIMPLVIWGYFRLWGYSGLWGRDPPE